MIDLKMSGEVLRFRRKLFYKKPKYLDALRFVEYYLSDNINNVPGFKRERMFTKVIDLTKPPDDLFAQFKKNTKYEIKRAETEGVRFEIENGVDVFIDFYNSFAKSKNTPDVLPSLKKNYIYSLKSNLIITKAVFDKETLVMHSYIADKEAKKARLLHTASLFRYENDTQKRNLIGRANRFLHYQDMIYFKNEGFEIYDMGGYACDASDAVLKKINEFKDCFGGELIEESNYISLPLYMVRGIRLCQKKFSIYFLDFRK